MSATEIVLDERTLQKHFQGAYDPILHSPYQVGDRLRRCQTCGNIIRTELIEGSACPGGRHTFVAAPVIRSSRITLKTKKPVKPVFRILLALVVIGVIVWGLVAMDDRQNIEWVLNRTTNVLDQSLSGTIGTALRGVFRLIGNAFREMYRLLIHMPISQWFRW